jgi:hypothetical protein
VRWAGRPLGADNDEVYGGWLGLPEQHRRELAERGVI